MADRLVITKGADVSLMARLKSKNTKDYFDLTGVTLIQFIFTKRDNTKLILTNVTIPATKAKIKSSDITFTAVAAGISGNGIILAFNGTDTIAQVISAWNTANPSNTVTSDAEDTSKILSARTIQLTEGYNSYTPVAIQGDPVNGKVLISMTENQTLLLKDGSNQSFTVFVDKGINTGGIRSGGVFENKLDVINSD